MVVRYKPGEQDERPWGRWEVIATGDTYTTKRIHVNPGGKLSLQLHHHRQEHWIIVSGTAKITIGNDIREYGPNSHVYIPIETQHRIEALDEQVVFIEVQYGDELDEDDIVRIEDVYGR